MRRHLASLHVAIALLVLLSVSGCASVTNDIWPYGKSEANPADLARFGPSPSTRADAIRHLAENAGSRPPEEQQRIAMQLAQMIRTEPDPLLRIAILQTIAVYPVPLAAKVLEAGLRDQERDVRVACCDAWGRRGGPEAVRALGGVVTNEADIDVRLAATAALGGLHEPGVVQALAPALEERQDPALQYRAVASLRSVTGRDYNNDLTAWRQFAKQDGPLPPPAAPSLAERFIFWWR